MLTSLFNSTSSFTFTFSDIPWTTMSVAYSNGDYYVAYGGGATAPLLEVAPNGTILNQAPPSPAIDFRSLFTDASGDIFARGGSGNVIYEETGGFGQFSALPFTLNETLGYALNPQEQVVLDYTTGHLIGNDNGTVTEWSSQTGSIIETVTLNGYTPSTYGSSSNIADYDGHWYTYSQGVVTEWDPNTGNAIASQTVPGVNPANTSDYGFGIANGYLFIGDKSAGTFTAFQLQNAALPPTANPDFTHAVFGQTNNVAAAGVLANDTPGTTGDTLTVSAVDGLSQNVGTAVAGAYGTLTLDADGSYTYKASGHSALPLTGVSEDFFGYTALEGGPDGGGSASSTLSVVVTTPGLAYVAAPVGGSVTQSNGLHYTVLDGSAGDSTLIAVNGIGAALVGGNGDTLKLANIGLDTVVAMGNFGQITVDNYKANGLLDIDLIQLSKADFGTNAAAIAKDATQAPGSANTVITDPVNHDTITLVGVSLSSLHFNASHFVLV